MNETVVILYNEYPQIWKIYTSHEDSIFHVSDELSSKITWVKLMTPPLWQKAKN